MMTAGPAWFFASTPVRVKMPVPMTMPTPKPMRSNGPSRLRSRPSPWFAGEPSPSWCRTSSMGFVLIRAMRSSVVVSLSLRHDPEPAGRNPPKTGIQDIAPPAMGARRSDPGRRLRRPDRRTLGAAEPDAAGLRAEGGQDRHRDEDGHDRRRQGERIPVRLGQRLLDRQVEGGQAVAELVRHTRVEATDLVRAELGEVGGGDTPGALHADLDEERAERQPADRGRVREDRHERQPEHGAQDDHATPAEVFGHGAHDGAADDRADVVTDDDPGRGRAWDVQALLEEGRV